MKRYNIYAHYAEPDAWCESEPEENGEWVKHDDHAAAIATLTAQRDRLRSLFAKYIAHVIACEGVDFINYGEWFGLDFTDEEWTELKALAAASEEFRA